MVELDMRTVIIANIIINVVSVVVLVQLWSQNRNKYAGFNYWIVAWVVQLVGVLLIGIRNTIPDWLSIVVANGMVISGPLILYFGLRGFVGKTTKPYYYAAVTLVFALFVFVHFFYTYVQDILMARSINASIGLLFACGLNAWLLSRGVRPELKSITKNVVYAFWFLIIISLVRVVGLALQSNFTGDYLQSGLFDTTIMALLAGGTILLVFNLVLMVNRRLHLESAQMADSLRETGDYMNSLFDHASASIIVLDRQFHITRFNHAAERLTGWSAAEVIGKNVSLLLPPEGHGTYTEYLQSVESGEHWEAKEIPVRHKDGSERIVLWNSASVYGQDGTTVISTVVQGQDITANKKAEEALQDNYDRMENIIEAVSVGTWEWNVQTGETVFNDIWAEMLGYTLDELSPISIKTWEALGHPEDLKESGDMLQRHFSGKLPYYNMECRMKHKDGHWVWIRDRGKLLTRTPDGKPLMMFGTHTDITDRKEAEEKIRRNNVELASINKKLQERYLQNHIMSNMRELLQSCSTMGEIPPIVSIAAAKIFPGTDGALFLIDNSRTELQSAAKWGDYPEVSEGNFFPVDACWGLRLGRIHVVEDPKTAPVCMHIKQPQIPAYICLPLIAKGETIGLLNLRIRMSLGEEERQKYISEYKEIAPIFVEYLALSIANLKLWERLADQSIRDPLTRLYNRRYMEETFQREIQRADRKQSKIGLIMADIDHFKKLNDTYGHKAGDEVLAKLAEFFKSKIRSSDIACRYGGEEFILILPESSNEDTMKRAEFMREEVKKMKVYFQEQLLPSIALSMGISMYPENGIDLNELVRIADRNLYIAKEQGRDRVIGTGIEKQAA